MDEDRHILLQLRTLASRLGEGERDELLVGQYAHLRARIDALIEVTECVDER